MKTILVYPVPFDCWDTFQPFVERFAKSFKEFPPGVSEYEVYAMATFGVPNDAVKTLFYGIKTRWVTYNEHGCDIGAAQFAATIAEDDAFLLCFTTRCYFHRRGWLSRYLEARQRHGPGLYGASASWEGRPHICTRAYALDGDLMRVYPEKVNTRERGEPFEVGPRSITQLARERELPTMQVTWDGERNYPDWRVPAEEGIFRRDGQAAMLVWDKWTDAYRDADPEEKERQRKLADPPADQ